MVNSYTEEMLRDPAVLNKFGFNEREVKFLSANPWWDLESLYVKPYLDKFKDEYQPFGVGYDDWDKFPMADIYKKDGASKTALGMLGGTSRPPYSNYGMRLFSIFAAFHWRRRNCSD